jgi:hypothetical protein
MTEVTLRRGALVLMLSEFSLTPVRSWAQSSTAAANTGEMQDATRAFLPGVTTEVANSVEEKIW